MVSEIELGALAAVPPFVELPSFDSDEEYDSDEHDGMTADRARRKLTTAISGAELDLATNPDFDHPSDENYNVQAALPILGCAKLYLVEIKEGIKWYGECLAVDGDAPADDKTTLVRMYHGMQNQGRDVGPRCLLQLSLIVTAYLDCLCNGRMQDLEKHRSPFDELPAAALITEHSVFTMRAIRQTSGVELRASRTEQTEHATGRVLMEMFRDLEKDINGALQEVGEEVPVTWRELVPHIIFVRQENGHMDTHMHENSSSEDSGGGGD
jgi:hypothetical protein